MPSGKTRIGNWQEDLVLAADKKKALLDLKACGGMLSQQILRKVRQHNQTCELAAADSDGLLRFHQPIMLQNGETEGFLSIDIDDKQEGPTGWRCIPTTVPQKKPVLRSSFVLMPVYSKDDSLFDSKKEGDVVHYGQKFVIQTHPDLLEKPMFLISERKTAGVQSKVTANQPVYFCEEPGQAGLWAMGYSNAEYRDELVGHPVKANSLAVIQHTSTNTPLASTKTRYTNDFGPENEVCVHRYQTFHSISGSAPERKAMLWVAVTGAVN
eukprot:Tbor_TRINITY_DN4463_c0_g1::TRINITY_DN4463_c0_g1_i1::g.7963::m.7963